MRIAPPHDMHATKSHQRLPPDRTMDPHNFVQRYAQPRNYKADKMLTQAGHVHIWSYITQSIVKTFELTDVPVRAGRFIARKNWIVAGSDDFHLRVYNYNTSEKVTSFEAHPDYIRAIAVHPTQPFVLTASDDMTIKLWDWDKSWKCVQEFAGHQHYVMGIAINPKDPNTFASACLDRTVKIWSLGSSTPNYTLEAHEAKGVNFIDYYPQSDKPYLLTTSDDRTVKNGVALGFDDGAVVITMGREEPAVSMDGSGKLLWAKNNDILTSVIKGSDQLKDGDRLSLPSKDLGTTELYPQSLLHSPNGRFVAVCGDGEYIIYTALALRNQAFGSAMDFCWASKEHDKDYAIRESSTSVKIFRNFKERSVLNVGFSADGLSGGVLLGVKGQGGIGLFDWDSGALVRRIEVEPKSVYWSESGELVTLATEDTFYVLRYSRENYLEAVQNGEVDEDGAESAFEVVCDINESVRTGTWVGDCFIYTNSTNRLNYLVGDQTYTISHFDSPHYVLGYLPRDSRIYIADKDVSVVSFALSLAVVEYQTLILRGDLEAAEETLPSVPKDQNNKIARFLEGQGYKEMALKVATDPEHRFDLALSLGDLEQAVSIAREQDTEHKWKTVGDAALTNWNVKLAQECFIKAKDLGSLLLLYSATSDTSGLRELADLAETATANNVAFSALWQIGDVQACIDLLVKTNRLAEAVLFSQTYKPSATAGLVKQWKESLEKESKTKVARLLGKWIFYAFYDKFRMSHMI
ncbi:coatomer subunit beta [Pyrenophora seminiperda CCB06]|uniref:Beta'-coat protein n=1 Tax=Pyrenophora seminiperda CCB06 TaxID=1302712 RepID=A0A3M7MG01_9PLEO|nr:coatomer subunit beta [Pyrenophora seminiperda CCB06]